MHNSDQILIFLLVESQSNVWTKMDQNGDVIEPESIEPAVKKTPNTSIVLSFHAFGTISVSG